MARFDTSRLIEGDEFHCVYSDGVVHKYTFMTCAKLVNVDSIIVYRNENGRIELCTQGTADSHFKLIERSDHNNKRVCVKYTLWEDKIIDWINSRIDSGIDISSVLPITLLVEAIGLNRSNIDKSYVLKMTKELRGLGYTSKLKKVSGMTGRYWDLSPK